jgi:hypothetical protein
MSSEDLMMHRAEIWRNTPTNTDGVFVPSVAEVGGTRCLVQEGGGRSPHLPDGHVLSYDAVVFLPLKTAVQPQGKGAIPDELRITYPSWMKGRVYQVQAVVNESGQDDHLTAFCKLLPKG